MKGEDFDEVFAHFIMYQEVEKLQKKYKFDQNYQEHILAKIQEGNWGEDEKSEEENVE